MGIQNSINNLIGTAGVVAVAGKHIRQEKKQLKLQEEAAALNMLNQYEEGTKFAYKYNEEMPGLKEKLGQSLEDEQIAQGLLDEEKIQQNEEMYNKSRKIADDWINQSRKQSKDYANRIAYLEQMKNVQDVKWNMANERLENVLPKGRGGNR